MYIEKKNYCKKFVEKKNNNIFYNLHLYIYLYIFSSFNLECILYKLKKKKNWNSFE